MALRIREVLCVGAVAICMTARTTRICAQPAGVQPIGARTGALAEGFTNIVAIGVLPDGRVMLADNREHRAVVGDFESGEVVNVSRYGEGPGEFREIERLFSVGGDSTVIVARRPAQWLLLRGRNVIQTGASWGVGADSPRFTGIDAQGNALELRPIRYGREPRARGTPPMFAYAESLVVLRHRSALARVFGDAIVDSIGGPAVVPKDTVARIHGPWRGVRTPARGEFRGAPLYHELLCPLASGDQAVLFPDGWIAIAFESPYRVEWVTPRGQRIAGPPLPFEGVKVDEAQQRFAIRRKHPRTHAMWEPGDFPPWPEVLPSLAPDALIMLPEGRLAIHRMPDARDPRNVYDIVDRRGMLAGKVRLESNERLVGAGPGVAYVVRKDTDDLEWLERRAWP